MKRNEFILHEMNHVKSISITQFRNYLFQQFQFTERIIAISGLNGTGKTNLLDAIYYLCFTKSYFSKPDIQSVFQNLQGFRIDGTIESKNEKEKIVCILRENNKKEFYLNDIQYKRFSKHIGKFTCVFIAPDDVQLITEGSETRRNFVDAIISQFDPSYLQYLIDYKKILEERNSLLKAAFEKDYLDQTLLNILDEQLIKNGNKIFDTRKLFLTSYIPEVLKSYTEIAGKDENIQLSYYSQLTNTPFEELLQQNLQRDLYIQRTSSGIHKDDLEIIMLQSAFKNHASQGQKKSLLFALKLAEFTILNEKKGYAPILLLDDIFEKLDDHRMNNLLHKVCVEQNGQVFITDTHKERLEQSLDNLHISYQLIEL